MTRIEAELVQQQAEAVNLEITVTHVGIERFSVTVGKYVYTDLHKALSAITTVFLKNK